MKEITTILFVLFQIAVFAQARSKIIKNQVLVKFNKGISPSNWNDEGLRSSSNLVSIELLSEYMNIWLMEYGSDVRDHELLLNKLRLNPEIVEAQSNHKIELKSGIPESNGIKPDDTEYEKQWQYHNDVVGGDINVEDVWDITTGGVSGDGDTIVLGVIDLGFDMKHEDFGSNLWVNYKEIPNNNKDDDGNGFIDDRIGWNAFSNSGDISENPPIDHGQSVAGIMGAKGNNGMGVTGISWDTKLMIIEGGGGAEAQAIKSYDFILKNRKLYNETNGEKGAFIVTVNSSWGGNGNVEDIPLWCAIYNTMGGLGILNVTAAGNSAQDQDIDNIENADLPGKCEGDYLLSVANQGKDGKLFSSSNYGVKSVDLGAPGENTWTLLGNNKYGNFGGTSAASPHVAGAIGLLYTAPCRDFAIAAKEKPAETALKIRKYILEGVTPNPELDGKTVTGGSLNVYNALIALLKDFNCSVSLENNNSQPLSIVVLPNPIGNNVFIKVVNSLSTNFDIKIYDIIGEEIIHKSNISFYNNYLELDISGMSKGLFFVKLTDGKRSVTKRIVKK